MKSKDQQSTPAPQRHIIDDNDSEDDYVEVTGVDEDVEDGWEEVMVANSPPRKTDTTPNTTSLNTTTTATTATTTKITNVVVTPQPTQPIAINNNNNAPQVLVEKVISAPSQPKEVPQAPQDPEWLATLKANGKVPYSASSLGDPQYTAPLVGEPYTESSIGLPYASPQDGGQYLAALDSTVSYLTTTTVMAKEQQNENEPPYCVAYP